VKQSARYVKIVEWSDADQSFVGQCPGIVGPCCHGEDEALVYSELCTIVNEWIQTMIDNGQTLPPATAGTNVAAKIA